MQNVSEMFALSVELSLNRKAYEDKKIPYDLYSAVNEEIQGELRKLHIEEGLNDTA